MLSVVSKELCKVMVVPQQYGKCLFVMDSSGQIELVINRQQGDHLSHLCTSRTSITMGWFWTDDNAPSPHVHIVRDWFEAY